MNTKPSKTQAREVLLPNNSPTSIELPTQLAEVLQLIIDSGERGITSIELSLKTCSTNIHALLNQLKNYGISLERETTEYVSDRGKLHKGIKRYRYGGRYCPHQYELTMEEANTSVRNCNLANTSDDFNNDVCEVKYD